MKLPIQAREEIIDMEKRTLKITIIIPIISLWLGISQTAFGAKDSTFTLLLQGRTLFYESVEKRDRIDEAIKLFNEIAEKEIYNCIAQTYLGALTALKGKLYFKRV